MTISHNGRVELCLGSLTYEDAGVYTCVATNEVGRTETSSRVEVHPLTAGESINSCVDVTPKIIADDIP